MDNEYDWEEEDVLMPCYYVLVEVCCQSPSDFEYEVHTTSRDRAIELAKDRVRAIGHEVRMIEVNDHPCAPEHLNGVLRDPDRSLAESELIRMFRTQKGRGTIH